MRITYYDKIIRCASSLSEVGRKPVWIDCTNISADEAFLLKDTFDLHPLTVEDLVTSNSRIKLEEFPSYLFCVFYGIRSSGKIHVEEIDFIIGKNFLITNHKKENPFIRSLLEDEARLQLLFKKSISHIFHKIVDAEIDGFFPVLSTMDGELEKIEEEATTNPTHNVVAKIRKMKRTLSIVKRVVFPQREKLSMLAKNEMKFVSKKLIPYFRDVYDHSIRIADSVENYREAVGNAFDVYMSSVSNNMNQVMKMLSIIATIALPLTVISGIYGTNFVTLPGSAVSYGFWVMVGFMVVLCLGMLFYFRKKKWL
jgi:magnesium transporter